MAARSLHGAIRRGREGERGAALVEFALVVPVLIALVFAILDFGSVYFQQLSVRNDTQTVARLAAVADFGTEACTPQGGSWSGNSLRLLCRTKASIQVSDKASIRVKVVLPDAGGFAKGNRLIICSQYPARSASGMYDSLLTNRYLKAKSTVRIEQPGSLTGAEELAPPGSDWGYCS